MQFSACDNGEEAASEIFTTIPLDRTELQQWNGIHASLAWFLSNFPGLLNFSKRKADLT